VPSYSPALVSFIPFGNNDIGWVALGPGDTYVPHYYNAGWQPYYLTNDNLYVRGVNLDVPGAVLVVPVDDFARGFDWRNARRADRNLLAGVNPVLDPLLHTPLRNAVLNSAWGRGKKDIPPGIAKKLDDTFVVTSTAPLVTTFRPELRRSLRVETVSDRGKGQKFNVKDERGRANGRAAQTVERPGQPEQRPAEIDRGQGQGQGQERRQAEPQRRVVQEPRVNPGQERRRERRQSAPQRQPAPQRQVVQQPARMNRGEERRPAAQAERPTRPAQQQPRGERVAQPRSVPARSQPNSTRTQPTRTQPQQKKKEPAAKPSGGRGSGKGKKP
jgi:hypothetical protein